MLVTLWVVVTLSFFLMQVMPGSPFNNPKLTNDMIAVMNKQYGLDKPVWQQYLQYLWNVLHGDLGTSYQSANQPVSMMISQRLAVSAQLGIQALVVGVLAGLFVGAVSARNKNNWIDNILSVLSTLGISVPSFIIGLLLLDYLGFKWGVLPLSGWGSFSQTILPTLALAIPVFAQVTRFFIEQIFSIPGIGQQFVTSIPTKDYPVIMGTTIVYAVMLMVAILLTDIITSFVDPRVRLK